MCARILVGLIITVFLAGHQSRAAAVRGVTILTNSTEFVSGTDQRRATNLVSSVGLFGDHHTATPQGNMWLSSPTTAGAYSNQFVTFDLGSLRTLSQIKVWNYNEVTSG